MVLGIIGAMDVEVQLLKENLEDCCVVSNAGMDFYKGKLRGVDAVVVQCGVGKVNAAICAQVLCSCFDVTHLINTGIAGSLDARLDICDLVISEEVMHHDMDCSCLGYPVGQVPGMDTQEFPADKELIRRALAVAEQKKPGHTWSGRIASGDQFIASKERKEEIIRNTQAICTEMEAAAIGHTAYRNGVPYVIIRAISDKADDSEQMEYPVFEAIAARLCAEVTLDLAKSLSDM